MSDKPVVSNLRVTQDAQTLKATAAVAYDADFFLWAQQQAELLRRMGDGERVGDQVDWSNVSEEIDALAKNQQRELNSRIGRIIEHLTKLQLSPSQNPRDGWRTTIRQQRDELEQLFEVAPSLRAEAPSVIARRGKKAATLAWNDLADRGEVGADVPLPTFDEDQILGDWFPSQENNG